MNSQEPQAIDLHGPSVTSYCWYRQNHRLFRQRHHDFQGANFYHLLFEFSGTEFSLKVDGTLESFQLAFPDPRPKRSFGLRNLNSFTYFFARQLGHQCLLSSFFTFSKLATISKNSMLDHWALAIQVTVYGLLKIWISTMQSVYQALVCFYLSTKSVPFSIRAATPFLRLIDF